MDLEQLRTLCLALPHVEECCPFGPDCLVYKLGGRMVAFIPLEADEPYICLKLEPTRAEDLRTRYSGITPGYHMNKRHWSNVYLQRDVPPALLHTLLHDSYHLIRSSLSMRLQAELKSNS